MKSILCTLSILVALGRAAPGLAYFHYEHKAIGDRGARAAFDAKGGPAFPWKAKDGSVLAHADGRLLVAGREYATFGDLVALYGDFRERVPDLLAERPKRIAELRRLVRSTSLLKHAPVLVREAPKGVVRFFLNQTHFSSSAVLTWHHFHQEALRLVGEAVRTGDLRHLWLALHHEGLGAHSLTDLFAPGHDLVDRRQLVTSFVQDAARIRGVLRNPLDALKGLGSFFKGLHSAAVHKNLHDQFNANGVRVENLRGTRWLAYGDRKYGKQTSQGRAQAVSAVRTALASLFAAYDTLSAVRGAPHFDAKLAEILGDPAYYQALTYLPVRYREARYKTTVLRRKKTLCAGASYCDLLQLHVVRALLGKK